MSDMVVGQAMVSMVEDADHIQGLCISPMEAEGEKGKIRVIHDLTGWRAKNLDKRRYGLEKGSRVQARWGTGRESGACLEVEGYVRGR